MRALNNPATVLPRQWIESALLHGFLLLCIAVYHWHSHGSLSFETKGFNKKSIVDLTTSSIHNTHFVEMFFEQSESIESHLTATEVTEVSSDTKAEIATDEATDTKIVIKKNIQAEVQTNVQYDKPVRSPRKQTQSATQASASVSHTVSQAVAKPRQTARPDHAHSPKPAYPLALRDLGVSGVVWLRVWVDKNGRPTEIELAKSSGYRLFDEAALRAVQHWHFTPAKNEQQNLASWVEFAVRFEING